MDMNLGVVFGGQSYEHEVSIVSAISLKNAIKKPLVFIFCDKDRDFYLIEEKNMIAKYFSSGDYKKAKQVLLQKNGFYLTGFLSKNKINVDVYVNLIHGCDGEDGKLASLFEFFNVQYIGPRIEPSVITYSKELTKYLAKKAGVKTLDYKIITRNEAKSFKYPAIIKPTHLGSSIGLAIVKSDMDVDYALDVVFEYDDSAIVEDFKENVKEYNLAGCKIGSQIHYSILEEPKKNKFLDFEQKYLDFSRSDKACEAKLNSELEEKIKNAFKNIYECGFDGALIRCDFFVIDDEVYLNEVNPNPGSLANYLFEDFETILYSLANSLPVQRKIPVSYKYINSLSANK